MASHISWIHIGNPQQCTTWLNSKLNYFGDLHTCLNKEVASKFDELKYNINKNLLGINLNFEL